MVRIVIFKKPISNCVSRLWKLNRQNLKTRSTKMKGMRNLFGNV